MQINEQLERFSGELERADKELFEHFGRLEVLPSSYLIEWSFTLFTKLDNLDLTSRVWDILLCSKKSALWKIALAMLLLNKQRLMASEVDKVYETLKHPQHIDPDALSRTVQGMRWLE